MRFMQPEAPERSDDKISAIIRPSPPGTGSSSVCFCSNVCVCQQKLDFSFFVITLQRISKEAAWQKTEKKGIFKSKHFACGTYKDPTMFCPISCFLTSFPHLIPMWFCALWDLTIQRSLKKMALSANRRQGNEHKKKNRWWWHFTRARH